MGSLHVYFPRDSLLVSLSTSLYRKYIRQTYLVIFPTYLVVFPTVVVESPRDLPPDSCSTTSIPTCRCAHLGAAFRVDTYVGGRCRCDIQICNHESDKGTGRQACLAAQWGPCMAAVFLQWSSQIRSPHELPTLRDSC
jgi:hypothetical protein